MLQSRRKIEKKVTSANMLKYRPDTPRSLEACLKLGIDPDSFQTKDLESFGGKGVIREVQEMRYEAYNANLIKKIKSVLQYKKDMDKSFSGTIDFNRTEGYRRNSNNMSSQMIEDLNHDLVEKSKTKKHHMNAVYEALNKDEFSNNMKHYLKNSVNYMKKDSDVKNIQNVYNLIDTASFVDRQDIILSKSLEYELIRANDMKIKAHQRTILKYQRITEQDDIQDIINEKERNTELRKQQLNKEFKEKLKEQKEARERFEERYLTKKQEYKSKIQELRHEINQSQKLATQRFQENMDQRVKSLKNKSEQVKNVKESQQEMQMNLSVQLIEENNKKIEQLEESQRQKHFEMTQKIRAKSVQREYYQQQLNEKNERAEYQKKQDFYKKFDQKNQIIQKQLDKSLNLLKERQKDKNLIFERYLESQKKTKFEWKEKQNQLKKSIQTGDDNLQEFKNQQQKDRLLKKEWNEILQSQKEEKLQQLENQKEYRNYELIQKHVENTEMFKTRKLIKSLQDDLRSEVNLQYLKKIETQPQELEKLVYKSRQERQNQKEILAKQKKAEQQKQKEQEGTK